MQTPPAPPTPPTAPTPIVSPPSGGAQPGAGGLAPATSGQAGGAASNVYTYSQLLARGEELSIQLRSATSRRADIARDLRRAPQSLKDGLQSQITELNGRIVQLEKDIASNGQERVLAKGREADGTMTSTGDGSSPFPYMPSRADMTAISVVFTLFVLCPIALSFSRFIWKRGSRVTAAPASRESDLRMERVEQAVDAIAVEVERISEGQRFVTQLMTQQPALGAGAAPPLRVAAAEPVAARSQR